jgi:hypothetical protein
MKEIYKLYKQHKRFMLNAGFSEDSIANKDNTSNIHLWKRGDIRMVFTKNKPIEMEDFVSKLIRQSIYRARRDSFVTYGNIKIDNDGKIYEK